MAEEFDINEEYEKIFGVEARESLFSADDEEYNALRQEILDAKREFNPKKSLPFEGIQLLAYDDFKRHEVVRLAEKQGYRIFYIRNTRNSKLVTYGAGYFNPRDSKFYVLEDCFFEESSYFNNLCNKLYGIKKLSFIDSFRKDSGTMTEKRLHVYESASLAASYYRGERTSFREWRDDRGKTLDAYYPKYKASNIDELEEKTFPDYVPPAPPPVAPEPKPSNIRRNNITEEVHKQPHRFINNITEMPEVPKPSCSHHVFSIKIPAKCNVNGYHDEEANRFVILKGSTFDKAVDAEFDETPLGASRRRFIEAACVLRDWYYEVTKDTKCKSASAAASYVLGRQSTYTMWKDSNGKYLKDFYPTRYVLGESKQNIIDIFKVAEKATPTVHLFFIKKDNEEGRFCDASGTYDPASQKFVLKAGSILSLGAAPTYNYSAQGIHRRNFLNKFCSKAPNGYRLRADYLFDSPSAAASYVIGRAANGWQEWRTESGTTLDEVFRQ